MMKKIITLILTLIFASNFFYTEVSAKTAEEKEKEKEANAEFKEDKKRAKKVSKKMMRENLETVMKLAEEGDIYAQIILIHAYRRSLHVHTNYVTSDDWRKKAEEQDKNIVESFIPDSYKKKKLKLPLLYGFAAYHAHSQNNFERAVFWAEMGASENDKFCLAYVGSAYYTGRGVGQDFKMAIDYLKQAGDEQIALQLLSDAYEKGNGVDKDLKKSKLYADYLRLIKSKKIKPRK